ncbi:MAG: hypothetical protein IJ330_03350 [Oscillospiraceae bacterium]|nr:hypothetical protein [Oscillospiraceae bacterium]
MNLKKLMAAFSAGVVAFSAMSAVAVSAKAQEALDLSYSTMFEEKITEGEVYVSIPSDKWVRGSVVDLRNDGENNDGRFIIKGVSKIYFRRKGDTTDVDGNLDRYVEMTKREDTVRLVMAPPGSESSEIEMIFKYRAYDDEILKGDIKVYGSNVTGTHLSAKSSGKLEGYIINKVCRDVVEVDLEDEEIAYCDVEKLYRDVVEDDEAWFLKDISSKAQKYEDAKLTFVFDRDRQLPEGYETNEDYNWNTAMKSMSLIINGKEVTAKPEINVGKETCTISFKWDDIKAQKEIFEKYTTMQTMVIKTENDYLDAKITEPDEVMDIELIEVKLTAPAKSENGEIKDDTVKENTPVEDFSAGASVTVFETTL